MDHLQQRFKVTYSYPVFFTNNLFEHSNKCLSNFLSSQADPYRKKILVILDANVKDHHAGLAEHITNYLRCLPGFELVPEIVTPSGGEAVKNDFSLFFNLVTKIDKYALDRHSFVIAIGGGSLLDLVGFISAISHRGLKHIRIPTTVLSQADSGVGVKNGINFQEKKNFLGSFMPPSAVFNDFTFLTTLERRDWRSGMAEAVKVALIKDVDFFKWITKRATILSGRDMPAMKQLIQQSAKLHLRHIGKSGDPFESSSFRPLDFGHWSAHKLEQLTSFKLRHGEAVSIGIALDSCYSYLLGWLRQEELESIIKVLKTLQLPLFHPLLDSSQVRKGLDEFRQHLGGQLSIPLLRAIGRSEDVHEINEKLLDQAVKMCKTL